MSRLDRSRERPVGQGPLEQEKVMEELFPLQTAMIL